MQTDLKLVEIKPHPCPHVFAPLDKNQLTSLAYLGAIAEKKRHAASLIVNLYNSHIVGADMYNLMYYCRGESTTTLYDGIMLLNQLCMHSESCEIYGSAFIESLIKRWEFRK